MKRLIKWGVPLCMAVIALWLFWQLAPLFSLQTLSNDWQLLASGSGEEPIPKAVNLNDYFRKSQKHSGVLTRSLPATDLTDMGLYFPYSSDQLRVMIDGEECLPDPLGIYRLKGQAETPQQVTVYYLHERESHWIAPGVLYDDYVKIVGFLAGRRTISLLLVVVSLILISLYLFLYQRTIRENHYKIYPVLLGIWILFLFRVFTVDLEILAFLSEPLALRLSYASSYLLLPLFALTIDMMRPDGGDPPLRLVAGIVGLGALLFSLHLDALLLRRLAFIQVVAIAGWGVYGVRLLSIYNRKSKNPLVWIAGLGFFSIIVFLLADLAYQLNYLSGRWHLYALLTLVLAAELFVILYHYRLHRLLPSDSFKENHEAIFGPFIDVALGALRENLLICDEDLIIREVLVACDEPNVDGSLRGQELDRFLFGQNADKRHYLKTVIEKALNASTKSERDLLLDLLPKEWKINRRAYSLDFRILEKPRGILLHLKEDSERIDEKERIAQRVREMDMVTAVIKNRSSFEGLVEDFRSYMKKDFGHLLERKEPLEKVFIEILMDIHTYIGLFTQFHLIHLTGFLKSLETELYEVKEDASFDRHQLIALFRLYDPISYLEKDLVTLESMIGPLDKTLGRFTIQAREFTAFRNVLRSERLFHLEEKFTRLSYPTLNELLSPHLTYFNGYIEKYALAVKPIEYRGQDIHLDERKWGPFVKALHHLFRNALEHGIEEKEERLKAEKEALATILCRARLEEGSLSMVVEDDGRGIDTDVIRDRLHLQGFMTMEEAYRLDDQAVKAHLFMETLTSKAERETMSGRGLGLAAVKKEVDRLKGTIEITSVKGKGTRISIHVPAE